MASSEDAGHLLVPTSVTPVVLVFSPSSPLDPPRGSTPASSSDPENSGNTLNRNDVSNNTFTRSISAISLFSHNSRASNRISVASSRRSVSSIRSHVSSFQNVRFDPDPIKDISFWGGLALLISNMTGPGLVTLPIVAQSAGWLPTVLVFGLVGILSALSSLFICEAMTEVPGNEHLQSNVEFSNLVLCFFGKRYHLLVQIICFLAMQTTNIASIAVSAQLFDNLLIKIFHRTCGIQVYPNAALVCVSEQLSSASPFTGVMIMTAGVLLSISMILPLGLLKLSENIWVQLLSFILILLIVLQWIVTFCLHGLDSTLVPAVGSDISQTFGTILFNYAFVTTVPSWANAKQPNVSIHKTVGWGVGITTIIYAVVAILGGMAYQISSDSSLIQAINSSPDVTILSLITGYTFPIAALITSIPINIIVIRYNLIQAGTCSLFWANIAAGVLPWLVAIPCMTGSGLTKVINWSSLFLVSTANFIIPLVLYIYSKKYRKRLSKLPIIELEQHERLSRKQSRNSFSGHSRRNTGSFGSVRRRLTEFSFHLRSQSYPDLDIAPSTGIAAASVVPVAVGIGSGNIVHRSISTENLATEPTRHASHRRCYTHHPTTTSSALEPNRSNEAEPANEPYFSYSRDGELFELEATAGHAVDQLEPRAILSSSHRPSGVSTVILHDPITEMAQRKAPLPRRVSHKDKILSMISEKHKRTVQQQAEKFQQEQSEKPVPPMILLSQSTVPEMEGDDDDLSDMVEVEMYSKDNESHGATNNSKKDVASAQSKDIDDTNANLSTDIKKLNRKSSVITVHNDNRATLTLPPLSPTLRLHTPMLDTPGSTGGRCRTPTYDRAEHILEPSPTLSPPHPPTSPHELAFRCSSADSPGRLSPMKPSISFSSESSKGYLRPDSMLTDSIQLEAGTGSATGGISLYQFPSTPDSAASIHFIDRTTSNESRPALSTPDLEYKSSFTDGTKRAIKAAMTTLVGSGPRLRRNSDSNRSASDGKSTTQLSRASLLDDRQGEEYSLEDDDQDTDDMEFRDASAHSEQVRLPEALARCNEARRAPLGRMAAAFVSQPGSFFIKTGLPSTSQFTDKDTQAAPCSNHSQSGSEKEDGKRKSPRTRPPFSSPGFLSFQLSQSLSFQLSQSPKGHNHGRTVSASATLQDRTEPSHRRTTRSQSMQPLEEKTPQNLLSVPESTNSLSLCLAPPTPTIAHRAASDTLSPTSPRAKDRIPSLAPSAPPSPQRLPLQNQPTALGGRNVRLSGSSKALAAPFQGGNNYSILGFSSSHPPSSPVYFPSSPARSDPDQSHSAQGSGSSWFMKYRHTRERSRSTMEGSARSGPPSPMLDIVAVPQDPMTFKEAAERMAASAAEIAELERQEQHLHESNFHLPQYTLEGGLAFETVWKLRAVPAWFPASSLKTAWGALVLLVMAISATIVYDFVQLAMGNDVLS